MTDTHLTERQKRANKRNPKPAGSSAKGVGRFQQFTVEQVEQAIKSSFGNLTVAAGMLKCGRGAFTLGEYSR